MSRNPSTTQFTGLVLPGLGAWPINVFEYTLTPADLTADATSQAVDVSGTFPANVHVIGGCAVPDEGFTGGSVSACTIQLGDTADPNELLTASNIFDPALGVPLETGGAYTPLTREAAYGLEALVTATGGNVSTITAGRARIYVAYLNLGLDPRA